MEIQVWFAQVFNVPVHVCCNDLSAGNDLLLHYPTTHLSLSPQKTPNLISQKEIGKMNKLLSILLNHAGFTWFIKVFPNNNFLSLYWEKEGERKANEQKGSAPARG